MSCKCAELSKDIKQGAIDNIILSKAWNAIYSRITNTGLSTTAANQLINMAGDMLEDALEHALQIANKETSVTYYYYEECSNSIPSIGIYQVSANEEIYYILPDCNYCTCNVYKSDVTTGHVYTCQHVLACKLGDAMSKTHKIPTKPSEIAQMTQAMMGISQDL